MELILDLLRALFDTPVVSTEDAEAWGQWRADVEADADWARRRKALAAHARADILVLAALHDGVITGGERAALADALPPLLAQTDGETTAEELLARWSARESTLASDHDLSTAVESLAHWLGPPEKHALFEAIVQLGRADRSAGSSEASPHRRDGRARTVSTVRLFGSALGIDGASIDDAEKRD